MSMNLSAKLDELQRGDRHLETTVALCEIRSQLQELTKSVESCQSEVSEVKRDMVAIKHELDTVQQVKEEIEELRECVDRLEEHTRRRKVRLLEQVGGQRLKLAEVEDFFPRCRIKIVLQNRYDYTRHYFVSFYLHSMRSLQKLYKLKYSWGNKENEDFVSFSF